MEAKNESSQSGSSRRVEAIEKYKNGTGKRVFSNGTYTGEFKDGKFHGKGRYDYLNGNWYDG